MATGVYQWSFFISTLPDPPTGINEASPPPPPETVATSTTVLADVSNPDALEMWLLQLTKRNLGLGTSVNHALQNDMLNLALTPWPAAISLGGSPPSTSVALSAVASWQQIDSRYNQAGSSQRSISVTTGVTNTQEETNSFGVTVGASVSAGWGPVTMAVNASFSAQHGSTTTISFSNSTTTTNVFDFPSNGFYQTWQLVMEIAAGDGGPALIENCDLYQVLSFPPNPPL